MIKFSETILPADSITKSSNSFPFYCGCVLQSERGFCNYVTDDFESFGIPTNSNYSMWYFVETFRKHSPNIKIVRPAKTTIMNTSNKFSGNFVSKSPINNCYNPIVAKESISSMVLSDYKLQIIAKDVRSFDDDNMIIAVCSDEMSYDLPLFSDDSQNLLSSDLKYGNKIKSMREIIPFTVSFEYDNFIILVLIPKNGKYVVKEKFVLSYDEEQINFAESVNSKYIYVKVGTGLKVNTNSLSSGDTKFVDFPQTIDFNITETELVNTINKLKTDKWINSIVSFESDSNFNLVANNTNTDHYNIICNMNAKRYVESDNIVDDIIKDFNGSSGYFTETRNKTIFILNMMRIWDGYSGIDRWISCGGMILGWFYANDFIKPLSHDISFGSSRLLFNPTNDDIVEFSKHKYNVMKNRNDKIYLHGNHVISNKMTMKNINNNGVIYFIETGIKLIQAKYKSIKGVDINKTTNKIMCEINYLLSPFYECIKINSVSYEKVDGVLRFYVILFFKDLLESFEMNIELSVE